MASGWGTEDQSGWYATRDFSMKNLQVLAGQKLPSGWQVPQNIKYLKERYGERCVVRKTSEDLRAELAGTATEQKAKGKK